MMSKRITIVDIAKESGYSVSAVSKALSDAPDISIKAKKRIRKKCVELGYIQNITASSLKKGNTKIIGILYDSFLNPFYNEMVYYIETILKKMHYSIIIYRSNEFDIDTFNNIISRNAEGLISFLTPKDEVAERIKAISFPSVVVGRDSQGISSVHSDNTKIGALAAEYLIKQKAKKPIYMGEIYDLPIVRERYDGFKNTLDKYGIESKPFFKEKYISNDAFLKSVNRKDFLNADSVFCFNDLMALDVLKYLNSLNKHDVLVIGVDCIQDEIPLPISLVSIGANKSEVAEKTVKELLSQIKENKLSHSHVIIDIELKVFNLISN